MRRVLFSAVVAAGVTMDLAECASAGHSRRPQRCRPTCDAGSNSCVALCQPSSSPVQPIVNSAPPIEVRQELEGAWRLVAFKSGNAKEFFKMPEGSQHIKIITGGRFVWTSTKEGTIVRSGMGRCQILGDKYTEHYEQVLDEKDRWFVGTEQSFTWRIEGNQWHHTGVLKSGTGRVEISEIWERMK